MASGSAHARAALAGNPSDGFAGAVLASCIGELRAWARAEHAIEAGSDPPSVLVDAAIARFGRGPCAVRWGTDVPREVGLGGSSAIVTAAVRALCALHGHAL
jgi:shikimate kinase